MQGTFFRKQMQFTRLLKIKINEALAEVGLFHSQWLVLLAIHRMEAASLVEISNDLNVEKPTITRTVKRLEEQGFIEKVASEDKRERRVILTKHGMVAYQAGQQIISGFETYFLADIPEKELRIAEEVIQQLTEKVQQGGF